MVIQASSGLHTQMSQEMQETFNVILKLLLYEWPRQITMEGQVGILRSTRLRYGGHYLLVLWGTVYPVVCSSLVPSVIT